MSDVLFNEVGVKPGTPYNFGDWKQYAIHNDKEIKGFFGDYRFLSNFFDAPVWFEGLLYPSTEHAFQAAKVESVFRDKFLAITASKSKTEWKKYPRVDKSGPEWDARKFDVMRLVLFEKFIRNKEVREKLLATGDRYLEETNHWGDTIWGVDITKGGTNELGKMLMKIRQYHQ